MQNDNNTVHLSAKIPAAAAAIIDDLAAQKRLSRTAALVELIETSGKRQDPATQIAELRRELLNQSETIVELAAILAAMVVGNGSYVDLADAAIEELRSVAGYTPGHNGKIKKIQAIAARLALTAAEAKK